MHDIRIALDDHLLGKPHRAGLGDTTDVVAAQVDQHQVFGQLLGIAEQVLLQRQISFFVGTAWTRAGDGADRDQAFLDPHQHFWRRPHHVEVTEVEEVHVGRRVEATQRAVQIDGCGLERDRHALGNHHLHAVASEDVVLDAVDRLLVILAAEAGAEGRLGAVALFEIQA